MLTLLRFMVMTAATEPLAFVLMMSIVAIGFGFGLYHFVLLFT